MSRLLPVLILYVLGALGGCVYKESPPETVRLDWRVPTVAPLPETKTLQETEGVQISVIPVTYEAKKTYRQDDKRLADPLFMDTKKIDYYFERRQIPQAVIVPNTLQFLVKINNKMERVFRGAGAVVTFNVGGKQAAVDQSAYAELLNALVPPRTEMQIKISGPALSTIPDNATLGLLFYDVVTATDEAGTIKKRSNFEWFFNYKLDSRSENEAVKPVVMQVNR